MNHEKYKEWIILNYYDELEDFLKSELENHIKTCEECRQEAENMEKILGKISQIDFFPLEENILIELRNKTHNNINQIENKKPVHKGILDFISKYILPQPKYAFSLGIIFVMGILLGFMFRLPNNKTNGNLHTIGYENISYRTTGSQISNLKFLSRDIKNGEIEISFDEIKNVQYKGSINDDKVQKILANSMLTEENPGTRLKAVDAIASNESRPIDNAMKNSLIKALKTDENPGVRKEAIRVLRKIPLDNEIKEAFLYVLSNDKNSGLRIAAINSLGDAKDLEKLKDINTQNILKVKMESDENDYIRLRAKTILMETK